MSLFAISIYIYTYYAYDVKFITTYTNYYTTRSLTCSHGGNSLKNSENFLFQLESPRGIRKNRRENEVKTQKTA